MTHNQVVCHTEEQDEEIITEHVELQVVWVFYFTFQNKYRQNYQYQTLLFLISLVKNVKVSFLWMS